MEKECGGEGESQPHQLVQPAGWIAGRGLAEVKDAVRRYSFYFSR